MNTSSAQPLHIQGSKLVITAPADGLAPISTKSTTKQSWLQNKLSFYQIFFADQLS